jgi:hypothetical protein
VNFQNFRSQFFILTLQNPAECFIRSFPLKGPTTRKETIHSIRIT